MDFRKALEEHARQTANLKRRHEGWDKDSVLLRRGKASFGSEAEAEKKVRMFHSSLGEQLEPRNRKGAN